MNTREILELRRRHLGGNLSLSYAEPLRIVRGTGATLIDDAGRSYLDCVNNVCHVGHCHPRVVEAAARQMAELNTNTRYLHAARATYAERLTGLFPEHLSVCFLVCTGSEANDLALRLARAATDRYDVAVLDGAYHGHTTALIELSPYKFAGPGGAGRAPHVHVAPAPDAYRGPHRRGAPELGERYAESVRTLAAEAPLAAFFAESLQGCGGQIVPPEGYLARAFEHVRAAGGVCVADEVQVGFGRVGTHMWAFGAQGARPDIVTLGKPIGNGHPLAAVVTTPAIAAAFDNGMEYFNTFGGNPVSCAVGHAVLDVLRDEQLQQHAQVVGERLTRGLAALAERHELIGDVRVLGLFVGVELVRDRARLTPAADEALAVVEALKQRGVLLSIDGPLHNVLKLKPPLVFSAADADTVVARLDEVLGELA
jgi:4-aminobutyrate aminotransferase-like enzyme